MPERARSRAAGWVRLATVLATIGAGAVAAVLFERETGGRLGSTAWWILGAAAVIAISGIAAVPTASGNRLTPAYIAVAACARVGGRL